jgi:Tfp pilus assembly protein PilF
MPSKNSQEVKPDKKLASAFFSRALQYHMVGDVQRAIADYSRAIDADPNASTPFVNRGILYTSLG